MSSTARRAGKGLLLLGLLSLTLALTPLASAWGSSVHHDQVTTIEKALKESPSIPEGVREKVDYDTIYAASLAPDDWRDATGVWGTWQYNMAENAYYEFQRIRESWAENDFDNAIFRIGVVLHYVGDALQMEHSASLRKWYREYIEPLGSEMPLWSDEETGGMLYPHHVRQQIEAYTDSDSPWYPRRPENYGTINGSTDNGSLDWFLSNYFYNPAIDNDYPTDDYNTVMGRHIRETNPYDDWSPDDKVDNRWFYWVKTRDPDISKMDADNTIRLTYNGVYRAIRDAWNLGKTPSDPDYWHWPTTEEWLSPRTYGEGMDTLRWVEGQIYASGGGGSEEGAAAPSGPGAEANEIPLLAAAGLAAAVFGTWWARRLRRTRKPRTLEQNRGGKR